MNAVMTEIEGRYSSQGCDTEGRADTRQHGPLAFVAFDVETTGKTDFRLPADDPSQPRICSAAMITATAELEPVTCYHSLVLPEGWELDDPGEAARVNGLTQARLLAEGVPIARILARYNEFVDQGLVFVGHNVIFDLKCARGALRRSGLPDRYLETKSICTMRSCTDICRIPARSGRCGWKWPSLMEAAGHFDIAVEKAHDAAADARTCLAVARAMLERGLWPEPHVPKSREER